MYLILTEDGGVLKSETVSAEDLLQADDGYVDVIDITDPENPFRYYDETWVSVEDLEPLTEFSEELDTECFTGRNTRFRMDDFE